MRLFCARPCSVSLEATGWVSRNPLPDRMPGLTPWERKYATTLSARRDDRSTLLAMPARCSAGPTGWLSVYPYTTTLAFCRFCSRGTYWPSADCALEPSWEPPSGNSRSPATTHFCSCCILAIWACCSAACTRASSSCCPCCWYALCDTQAADSNAMSGAARAPAARLILMAPSPLLLRLPLPASPPEARRAAYSFVPCPAPSGFSERRRGQTLTRL